MACNACRSLLSRTGGLRSAVVTPKGSAADYFLVRSASNWRPRDLTTMRDPTTMSKAEPIAFSTRKGEGGYERRTGGTRTVPGKVRTGSFGPQARRSGDINKSAPRAPKQLLTPREARFRASRDLDELIRRIPIDQPLAESRKALDELQEHFSTRIPRFLKFGDAVLWNQLISTCVRLGDSKRAFKLLNDMKSNGVPPNPMTIVSVFRALLGRLSGSGQSSGDAGFRSKEPPALTEAEKRIHQVLLVEMSKIRENAATGRRTAVGEDEDVHFPVETEHRRRRSAAVEAAGEDGERTQLPLAQRKDTGTRFRDLEARVAALVRTDWADMLKAYILAITLFAKLRQEPDAWLLYQELSLRSPDRGRTKPPFPHRSIFSVVLSHLRGQVTAATENAETPVWRSRLNGVVDTWLEELKRAQTANLSPRFTEGIAMTAETLAQVVQVLTLIDTPESTAKALDIFSQISGIGTQGPRLLWTQEQKVQIQLRQREARPPIIARLPQMLDQCAATAGWSLEQREAQQGQLLRALATEGWRKPTSGQGQRR